MPFVPIRIDSTPSDPGRFVADPSPSLADSKFHGRSALESATDLGLEILAGGLKGVKFLSSSIGAGNLASLGLSAADESLKGLQSDQAKAEDRRIAEIMRAAEDAGMLEQIQAALRAAGQAPVRQALGAVATGIPTIAASLIPGVPEASWAARLGTLGAVGAAQGAGVVKSAIHDNV